MKKLYKKIIDITTKKHPHTEQMFGGGYLLTNKKNPLKNVLFKNINELNLTLILTLGVLFIVFSGYTSYAIFIDTQTSSKNISVSFPSTGTSTSFSYTGSCQTYTVSNTGYYLLEAWGAQGGTFSGYTSNSKGGYTSGVTKLSKGEKLYICVGQAGSQSLSQTFNGGGKGGSATEYGSSGGGATDIRLVNGSSWSDTTGLNSRIMVAAGGGGSSSAQYSSGGKDSSAGGLLGTYGGYYAGHGDKGQYGKGATQTSGGSAGSNIYEATGTASAGSFGIGGANNTVSSGIGGGGGGGGYYGGGAGGGTKGGGSGNGAGGGSSFISGYAGVNAITSSTSRTHTYNTLHYSGKYFTDTTMTPATNAGNGKAKITFLSSVKPKRTNKTLDGVRYIKDCINGSNTAYTSNHWVELQAIYNGTNVAKGKTATGTATISNASYITNGDITSSNYADITSGTQCITIDLGQEYDLDEIAVWHYWSDGRTYNNNITYVSNDNSSWIVAINRNEAETSQGKRTNAYIDTLYNEIENNVTESGSSGVFLYNDTDDNAGSNSIYYYKGNVTNNNVWFANLCWKIVRTTSTGGVKLIYNGTPTSNGQCTNTTGTATQYNTSQFNSNNTSPSDIGYMYGTRYTYSSKTMSSISDTYKFGNTVTYSNGTYTLSGSTISYTGSSWSTARTTLANGYHYTCFNSSGSCSTVYYIIYFGNSTASYYLSFSGGTTIDTAKTQMYTNTNNSTIKTAVDSFYTTKLSNYTDYLENTIFCNDRSSATGTYGGSLGGKDINSTGNSYFGAFTRAYVYNNPSFKCVNSGDKFSLSTASGGTSGYGNNKLTYPVGLLTYDEVVFAGGRGYTDNTSYYLYTATPYWLLSPSDWYLSWVSVSQVKSGGSLDSDTAATTAGVRPVVSLSEGITFVSGDGSAETPYLVKDLLGTSSPLVTGITFTSTSNTLKITGVGSSTSAIDKVCINASNTTSGCSWLDISSGTYTNTSYSPPNVSGLIYVFVKDKAGNISKSKSYTVTKFPSKITVTNNTGTVHYGSSTKMTVCLYNATGVSGLTVKRTYTSTSDITSSVSYTYNSSNSTHCFTNYVSHSYPIGDISVYYTVTDGTSSLTGSASDTTYAYFGIYSSSASQFKCCSSVYALYNSSCSYYSRSSGSFTGQYVGDNESYIKSEFGKWTDQIIYNRSSGCYMRNGTNLTSSGYQFYISS